MNDLVRFEEPRQLTAAAIRANVNLVQEVMQAVMKKDTHYGTIPGTPKPTLFKPGAEVLAATFRIAVSYRIEDLSTQDAVRYRVVDLQAETSMHWLKEQIAADFAEKQRLTQAMDDWYGSGRRGRFPCYEDLDAVTARLSRLDSAYKGLWDRQREEAHG